MIQKTESAGLPRVIFLGPLKTGTTWVHEYLSEFDEIVLPKGTKETFFFDRYYDQGMKFYRGFFPNTNPIAASIVVEVAPSYGGDELALERIAAELKNVTVVISVRDPVERTLSQYWHELRYGYYRAPLNEHLGPDDPILRRSDYPHILAEAVRVFGSDHVKLLDFGELRRNPYLFCARVCACLGVPYHPPSEKILATVSNERRVPRSRMMTRLTSTAVDLLKRYGLNSIPELAKKMGIRRLVERPVRQEERGVSQEMRNQVQRAIGFDYEEFLISAADYVPVPAIGFEAHRSEPSESPF